MRWDGTPTTWRSPGRIELIGHEDFCLCLAMPPGCAVTVSPLSEDVLELGGDELGGDEPVELRLADLEPGCVGAGGWQSAAAGVVWAFGELGYVLPGLSLSVQTGPRADPALACAAAIADLCRLGLGQSATAAVALRARHAFSPWQAGGADELVALFAQPGHALLCSAGTGAVGSNAAESIAFDLDGAGLALLAVDCRTGGDLAAQAADCADAARELGVATVSDLDLDDLPGAMTSLSRDELRGRVRHIVSEHDRTQACAELLRAGHLREIGPLLTASGASLRADYAVEDAEAELAVAVMFAFDAFGARVTGDGWALGLLTPDQARACAVGIRSAFSGRGYLEPASHTVTPVGALARA